MCWPGTARYRQPPRKLPMLVNDNTSAEVQPGVWHRLHQASWLTAHTAASCIGMRGDTCTYSCHIVLVVQIYWEDGPSIDPVLSNANSIQKSIYASLPVIPPCGGCNMPSKSVGLGVNDAMAAGSISAPEFCHTQDLPDTCGDSPTPCCCCPDALMLAWLLVDNRGQ
jgi:hypothetical protein